ncbi:Retrovirus-related Pol polyprotein from transposon 17.6 [Eumeta japonica]|uniref:RNA-directed DNA polymerase n=1 Tax=Eumeta variegata TaxID=151549 RepID=A0A4C1SYI3_EUMVA|nr:Retrovirus-related Pol polyprotein from transposon 17.6 [Eumeta japonica]
MFFENETINKNKYRPHDSELIYFKEEKDKKILSEGILNAENGVIDINLVSEDSHITTQKVDHNNFSLIEEKESKPLLEQIRTDHLNFEEKRELFKLIRKYLDIFYKENTKLTFTSVIKHEIRTTDNIPIHTKSYRYPYIHKNEVQKQIQEMLDNKIIRHSNSPYSAPIWIVAKKADASGKPKWRLVIDYRKLNEVTIDDRYPIPNIDEILDKLGRCQYFTTLDLAKGFHQIEIKEEDVHKTAFTVEGGHYEFLRMPFGLKTAPATFQRLMNNILKDYINKICLVYLDDIIIFSTSLQEHINSINLIFQRLQEANLKVQLDKSEFLKKETEFLGHIVTPSGIKANPKKIECVKNFPIPKTPKQIKQFLGLTGYYRKFIKDYSMIAKPMTRYLKKDIKMNINDPQYIESFNTLRTLLTHDPILAYPNFSKKFTLTTDASNFALGANSRLQQMQAILPWEQYYHKIIIPFATQVVLSMNMSATTAPSRKNF